MIKLYTPQYNDLWFRKMLMEDEDTMSFNHAWGGTIDFPEEEWKDWYQYWIVETDSKRFYKYLVNENNEFVGEIAYHFDEEESKYIADIIVYSKYRGRGYGREGLQLLCEAGKSNGLNTIYDDIAIDNPSITLFLSLGFVEEYRTDEIIMLKKQIKIYGGKMELRKLNLKDAYAQWEYTTALPEDENGLTNPFHGVSFEKYKDEVLPKMMSYENPIDMPDWFVPETYYYLWDDGRLIGEFRIRHHLTEALRNGAGHIGYSIKKEYRGKGYGTKGLELTLKIARTIVPEDEIYLRLLKTNKASLRVMEKNGARCVGEDEEHFFMRIQK